MGKVFFKEAKESVKATPKGFFDLEAKDIDGNLFKFSNLRDKKAIVVVNVACKCGYTSDHYR